MQIIKPAGFVETSHYPLLLMVYVHTHTHTHVHTHARTHTHIHTHARTHLQPGSLSYSSHLHCLLYSIHIVYVVPVCSTAATAPPVGRWCRSASTWTGPRCWWAASAPSWCALTAGAAASRAPTCCTGSRRNWVCSRRGTSWRRSGPLLFAYWQWRSGVFFSGGATVYDFINRIPRARERRSLWFVSMETVANLNCQKQHV